MPIDRRIANGLAWAGALVVVAIPAADAALRQFGPQSSLQVAVVEAQPEMPALPTSASQRPEPVVTESPVVSQEPAVVAKPESKPVVAPDPVVTATAQTGATSGDALDDFLKSGRPLPSYISDGGNAAPSQAAPVTSTTVVKPAPVATAPEPEPEQVAALPRTRIVTFPTPVSERPPSVPSRPVAAQPPLVVETQPPLVTAADLDDWESGPLSEFLARRQAGTGQAPADYDPDGFFLDQGPNSSARVWRFPEAYEDGYYPFE